MTAQNYRIRIKLGEVEIEAEGDKEFVEKHIEEFKKEMPKIAKELPPKEVTPEIPKGEIGLKGLSLVEFYKKKQPKDHNDTVVVFAYWLAKRKGQEEFQTKDISACYDEARIPKPKNVPQHILAMTRKACLTAGSKKGWYKLTLTGEEFIEKELSPKSEE
jgi:hypothetical protein